MPNTENLEKNPAAESGAKIVRPVLSVGYERDRAGLRIVARTWRNDIAEYRKAAHSSLSEFAEALRERGFEVCDADSMPGPFACYRHFEIYRLFAANEKVQPPARKSGNTT